MINTQRIQSVIKVKDLAWKEVAVIGVGGSAGLCEDLIRSGVGHLLAVDYDIVDERNICRQGYADDQIGMPKVEALKQNLHRIDAEADIKALNRDFLSLDDEEAKVVFSNVDVFVFATDNFEAQARGNQVAL